MKFLNRVVALAKLSVFLTAIFLFACTGTSNKDGDKNLNL